MTKHDLKTELEKVVVSAGVGRASQHPNFKDKILPQIIRDISALAGQKPALCPAKKSIAGFKIRMGQIVGVRATLRGRKMVDFFNRLTTIVLPRVHDFQGIARTAMDARGALNIGLKEQYVFPEISSEESQTPFSLGVTIVPKKKNKQSAQALFEASGVPFVK